MVFAAADNQLAADPVPFAFGVPIGGRTQIVEIIQLISQIERVGAREVGGGIVRLDQCLPCRAVGRPVAHQFMGQLRFGLSCRLRQRTGDQFRADPNAKAAC